MIIKINNFSWFNIDSTQSRKNKMQEIKSTEAIKEKLRKREGQTD